MIDPLLLRLHAELDQSQASIDAWVGAKDHESIAALSSVLQEMMNDPEAEVLEKIIARLAHHALAASYCRLEIQRNGAGS